MAEARGWVWYRTPHIPSDGPQHRTLAHPEIHEYPGQSACWLVRADGTERQCNMEYMEREGYLPRLTLDEMHAAALTLPQYLRGCYTMHLRRIVIRDATAEMFDLDSRLIEDFWFYQSTARQRAEAFLYAHGKWKCPQATPGQVAASACPVKPPTAPATPAQGTQQSPKAFDAAATQPAPKCGARAPSGHAGSHCDYVCDRPAGHAGWHESHYSGDGTGRIEATWEERQTNRMIITDPPHGYGGSQDACGSKYYSYTCELPSGHAGLHKTLFSDGGIRACWSGEYRPPQKDVSGEKWWCHCHNRPATHINFHGLHECAPGQGGILLTCIAFRMCDVPDCDLPHGHGGPHARNPEQANVEAQSLQALKQDGKKLPCE